MVWEGGKRREGERVAKGSFETSGNKGHGMEVAKNRSKKTVLKPFARERAGEKETEHITHSAKAVPRSYRYVCAGRR